MADSEAPQSRSAPGLEHVYILGTDQYQQFVIGNPYDSNDFYLMGLLPAPESALLPSLSGRILSPQGDPLVSFIQNKLDSEIAALQWIHGKEGKVGFDLRVNNETLFSVETTWAEVDDDEVMQTRILGKFYDRKGNVAASGDESGMSLNCPIYVPGVSPEPTTEARKLLLSELFFSGGYINHMVTGLHQGQTIPMDGALFHGATITNCILTVGTGHFDLVNSKFSNVQFKTRGQAETFRKLFKEFLRQGGKF